MLSLSVRCVVNRIKLLFCYFWANYKLVKLWPTPRPLTCLTTNHLTINSTLNKHFIFGYRLSPTTTYTLYTIFSHHIYMCVYKLFSSQNVQLASFLLRAFPNDYLTIVRKFHINILTIIIEIVAIMIIREYSCSNLSFIEFCKHFSTQLLD